MKKIISLLLIANSVLLCSAQNIGIGTNTPNNSALLDVSSTTKGLLIPRMTSAQRTAIISPVNGLMVYDITTNSFWYYNGSAWANPIAAVGGDSFTLPYSNTIALTTTAFKIKNDEYYHAIEGESTGGTGVSGKSIDGPGLSGTSVNQNGVYGYSATGNGVYAKSGTGPGLYAFSADGAGVNAFSTNGSGVTAFTNNTNPSINAANSNGVAIKGNGNGTSNTGVEGVSNNGNGVYGHSTSGTGVYAFSSTGYGVISTSTNNSAIYAYNNNALPAINASNTNTSGVAIKGSSTAYNAIVGTSGGVSKAGVLGEAMGSGGYGVYGTSSSDQGYGVYGNNLTGIGIYGFSNTGTGMKALSNSGLALEVNGKLKITGGNTNPSAGAVLTSDVSGNAVWKNNKIAFSADDINPNYASLANNTWTRVHFGTEEYDYGNDYTLHVGTNPGPTSSIFTVPVSGVYRLTSWVFWHNNDSDLDGAGMRIMIKRAGSTSILGGGIDIAEVYGNGENISSTYNEDEKLMAGDIIYVEVFQRGTSGSPGAITGGKFQAHLVFAD